MKGNTPFVSTLFPHADKQQSDTVGYKRILFIGLTNSIHQNVLATYYIPKL